MRAYDKNIQIPEAQRIPRKISTNKNILNPYNQILKVKAKEKILKAATKNRHVTYKRAFIRLLAYFSAEMQPMREWDDIFEELEKNQKPTRNTISSNDAVLQNKEEIKKYYQTSKS